MRYSQHSIVRVIASRPARARTCAALAVAFAATPVISPVAAHAVSAETQAEINEAAEQVDQYAAAYNEAVEKLDELQKQIEDNTARIEEIEAELPEMQQRASDAMREMYKYRTGTNPLANLVLKSESLSDFITTCVYMEEVQSANLDAIDGLTAAQQELEQKKAELDDANAQLEDEKEKAEEALKAAQQARSEAQAKAEAEAAAELAALQAESEAEQTAPGTGSASRATTPYGTATPGDTVDTSVSAGGVNWNVTYDEFVNEWGTRIDNYLAGSPMAGTGRIFADAAWNSGTDPRCLPPSPASRARRASTSPMATATTPGAGRPSTAASAPSAAGRRASARTSPISSRFTARRSPSPPRRSTARQLAELAQQGRKRDEPHLASVDARESHESQPSGVAF